MITLMRTDTPLSHLCFRCCGGLNKVWELEDTNDYNKMFYIHRNEMLPPCYL